MRQSYKLRNTLQNFSQFISFMSKGAHSRYYLWAQLPTHMEVFFFLPFTHKACCLAHRLRTQNFIPMYYSMFWLLLDHSDIYIILKFSYYLKHCSSHSTCSRDKGFIEKWTYAIISIGRFYFLIVIINMLHS